MSIKKLFILLFVILSHACRQAGAVEGSTLLNPKPTFAQEIDNQPQVLIINQVRGTECCEPGSLENLKQQIEILNKYDLPAFFTLRYDVLNNPDFIDYLNNIPDFSSPYLERTSGELPPKAERDQIGEVGQGAEVKRLGLFIEITPQLATDAGVEYLGDENTWYEAQHAYTIGYSPEDRLKLVDQLFKIFKAKFGYYPEITTGWMLDTPTLNYIHEKYGIKVHQITREQWGTDSYTLYGGPPHYPYPASENWLFMSDHQRQNAPLIVRQTLTDPLYNYGDMSSSFTSQPNDYMQDGKDIEYFKNLVNQALFDQPNKQTGFTLLGLENSMEKKYQEEYFKQLKFISSLSNINIVSDLEKFNNIYKDSKINIYYGKDIINKGTNNTQTQVYWISSPNYRIRLKFEGKEAYISDYRIINAKLKDPYTRLKAENQGYWITPFIIDGSRWPQARNFWEKIYLKYPWWAQYGLQTHSDTEKITTRLDLPDKKIGESVQISNNNLSYLAKNNKKIEFLFTPESFSISNISKNQIKYRNYHSKSFPLEYKEEKDSMSLQWGEEKETYNLEIDCSMRQKCIFNHDMNTNLDFQLSTNLVYFFPETQTIEELEPENIDFYAHNSYAIAGRNPIRLILIIKNENNFPSIPTQSIIIKGKNSNEELDISKLNKLQNGIYFIDINSNKILRDDIQISFDNQKQILSTKIYFAPNCKAQILYCLMHPKQSYWYIQSTFRDIFRE